MRLLGCGNILLFSYWAVASNLDEITIFNFLGPITGFSLLYFLAYFAPVPHPRENISDIEGYYSQKLPKSQTLLGIFVVVNAAIQSLTLDPSLLLDPSVQVAFLTGIFYTGISFTFRPLINRFGIRRVKIGGVLFSIIFLAITLQNPFIILTGE